MSVTTTQASADSLDPTKEVKASLLVLTAAQFNRDGCFLFLDGSYRALVYVLESAVF